MALLELKNLHVALEDGTEIVKGVDLAVNTDETHAIMGPNGSGKSTLAYALMAGRLAGLALVQVMPDLGGHSIPGFPTFGLFSTFPSLVLSAWLVQISAGRVRAIVY